MKQISTDRLSALTDWMHRKVDNGMLAGCSALVAQQGSIRFCDTAGLRRLGHEAAFDRDTVVRIYSMTKPVVTLALLQLVENQQITLDQPVADFLPEFATCEALQMNATSVEQTVPCRPPTLRELLTHTSGLTYGFNTGVLADHYRACGIHFEPDAGGLRPMVRKLAQQPLAFQPGTRWEYSVGIDVVGAVIEVVSGQSLDRYLARNIFDPLGMTDTSFGLPPQKQDRFADCYLKSETQNLGPFDAAGNSKFHENVHTTCAGGGGLLSTLDDYFRFAEMLRCKGQSGDVQIAKRGTVECMFTNQLASDIAAMGPTSFAEMPMTGVGFGLGGAIVLDPMRSGYKGSRGDYGWGGIAGTYFWIDPAQNLTCIFLTQLIGWSANPLRAELKALVHSALD